MKNQLLKGTIILTMAGFITRLIGFVYRIFLAGELGEVTLGVYQLIFPVYSLCFTIYAAGLQTGVSQLISHQPARQHGQILKAGILLSLFFSLSLSLLVFSFRQEIAVSFLGTEETAPLLLILSFIFPICGITALINGYFYGINQASIPAVTQILEQLFRVTFVFVFCFYDLLPFPSVYLAVAGLLAGELISNLYNITRLVKRISLWEIFRPHAQIRNILALSLPLSGTKLIVALLSSVESVLIPPILCQYGYSMEDALALYGILTGVVLPFILFPGTITNSMSVLLLPAISRASGTNQKQDVRNASSVTVRYSLLLGVITCAVFLNFGTDIGQFIFHSSNAGKLLTLLAFLCPFLYVTTTLGSIINGLGKTGITFSITVLGLVIRIGCLFVLTPQYGIFGYLFGLLCSQITICLLHGLYLMKRTNLSCHLIQYVVWPFIFTSCLFYITRIAGGWLAGITGISLLSFGLLFPALLIVLIYLYQAGLISLRDVRIPR